MHRLTALARREQGLIAFVILLWRMLHEHTLTSWLFTTPLNVFMIHRLVQGSPYVSPLVWRYFMIMGKEFIKFSTILHNFLFQTFESRYFIIIFTFLFSILFTISLFLPQTHYRIHILLSITLTYYI